MVITASLALTTGNLKTARPLTLIVNFNQASTVPNKKEADQWIQVKATIWFQLSEAHEDGGRRGQAGESLKINACWQPAHGFGDTNQH